MLGDVVSSSGTVLVEASSARVRPASQIVDYTNPENCNCGSLQRSVSLAQALTAALPDRVMNVVARAVKFNLANRLLSGTSRRLRARRAPPIERMVTSLSTVSATADVNNVRSGKSPATHGR